MARLNEEYFVYDEAGTQIEESGFDNLYEDVGNKPDESASPQKTPISVEKSDGKSFLECCNQFNSITRTLFYHKKINFFVIVIC